MLEFVSVSLNTPNGVNAKTIVHLSHVLCSKINASEAAIIDNLDELGCISSFLFMP
jgi:hypothetical protein